MNTIFEKNKLYEHLGKKLIKKLKKYNAFVAGGAITSLFTNKDINDIDIYFRDEKDLINFITEIYNNNYWIVSCTDKSILFQYKREDHNCIDIQLIYFKYFKDAYEIFNTFDFTVNMGAFDFKTEEFVFHDDFLKHNSQRILKFNDKTAFPIISLLRVQKYKEKGFSISKPELLRIALTCMKLKINTYDELKNHLGGMYGVNLDKLFEEIEGKEFDLQEAIDVIANVAFSDDYFVKPKERHFENLNEIIEIIEKERFNAIKFKNTTYRILPDGKLSKTNNKKLANYVDINDFFTNKKIYKFVKKDSDGALRSFYDNKFIYQINEEVVANNEGWNNGALYFSLSKSNIDRINYYYNDKKVLIEATFKTEDIVDVDGDMIMVTKAFITREVPKEEWSQWIKDDE